MVLGGRGAQHGADRGDPDLVGRHDVGVALGEHQVAPAAHVVDGAVEGVEIARAPTPDWDRRPPGPAGDGNALPFRLAPADRAVLPPASDDDDNAPSAADEMMARFGKPAANSAGSVPGGAPSRQHESQGQRQQPPQEALRGADKPAGGAEDLMSLLGGQRGGGAPPSGAGKASGKAGGADEVDLFVAEMKGFFA